MRSCIRAPPSGIISSVLEIDSRPPPDDNYWRDAHRGGSYDGRTGLRGHWQYCGRGARGGCPAVNLIPTFDEVGNIVELLSRIDTCLQGVGWEAIVVDDNSADGTADLVAALGARDSRIRCLRRIGRRGLSGARLEGMESARDPYFAIMDADLQHDEQLLPVMCGRYPLGAWT